MKEYNDNTKNKYVVQQHIIQIISKEALHLIKQKEVMEEVQLVMEEVQLVMEEVQN